MRLVVISLSWFPFSYFRLAVRSFEQSHLWRVIDWFSFSWFSWCVRTVIKFSLGMLPLVTSLYIICYGLANWCTSYVYVNWYILDWGLKIHEWFQFSCLWLNQGLICRRNYVSDVCCYPTFYSYDKTTIMHKGESTFCHNLGHPCEPNHLQGPVLITMIIMS